MGPGILHHSAAARAVMEDVMGAYFCNLLISRALISIKRGEGLTSVPFFVFLRQSFSDFIMD